MAAPRGSAERHTSSQSNRNSPNSASQRAPAGDTDARSNPSGGGNANAKNAARGYRWSPGHQPISIICAVPALRQMKSFDGGSTGRPEKSPIARSNVPHHAFTGVARPRYGDRNAPSTSAAWVAAAKYSAT